MEAVLALIFGLLGLSPLFLIAAIWLIFKRSDWETKLGNAQKWNAERQVMWAQKRQREEAEALNARRQDFIHAHQSVPSTRTTPVHERCPWCSSPMTERIYESTRRPFLQCVRFPDCLGTREVTISVRHVPRRSRRRNRLQPWANNPDPPEPEPPDEWDPRKQSW